MILPKHTPNSGQKINKPAHLDTQEWELPRLLSFQIIVIQFNKQGIANLKNRIIKDSLDKNFLYY